MNFSDPFGLIPYVNCRPVTDNPRYGHCAVRVVDARRNLDVTIEMIPGSPDISAPFGRKDVYRSGPDHARTKAYDPEGWVQVATPEGMTDQEFDTAVLHAAVEVAGEERGQPYMFTGEQNSNRFVYSVITRAGGKVPGAPTRKFPKGAPGACGGKGMETGTDCQN